MNHSMSTRDINFAYKVRHALNARIDDLPKSTTDRLAKARLAALGAKKNAVSVRTTVMNPVFVGSHQVSTPSPSWLGRLGVIAPLVLGAAIFVGIYQSTQQQRISDLADIDAAVLADELPLSAYLDHGFNAYLAKLAE